jgi:peptidoglycan/xylan/chitin deacetylase (PgdA/CDA1 family)
MYLHFTNSFIHKAFPHFTWKINTDEKVIFLTFDDGPIPEVTPWVLGELEKYDAKATFFCVGDNIRKSPSIFEEVIARGHSIGNHTFNHLNGWQTTEEAYLENVQLCEDYLINIQKNSARLRDKQTKVYSTTRPLFRPPHGRLSAAQSKILRTHYQIVMWDVLTGDFDQNLDKNTCLQKAIRYTKKGSIVVFHDSQKAKTNLYHVLPRYLEHFSNQGFRFEKL